MAAIAAIAVLAPSDARAAFPGENGRIVYLHALDPNEARGLFTVLDDGGGRDRLTEGSDGYAQWSSDGTRIVFVRAGALFTIGADGGGLTQVVGKSSNSPAYPSFSPDGSRILYRGPHRAIWTIRTDGTRPRAVLGKKRGRFKDAVFSPDGRRIALSGLPEGRQTAGIWTVRSDGSRFRRVTSDFRDEQLDYSPDGRQIVYVRAGGPKPGVRMVRANGSHDRAVLNGEDLFLPKFAPSGERIVFTRVRGPFSSCADVYTMSLSGTDARRVTDSCDRFGGGPSSSASSWQPLPPPPSSEFEITKVKRDRRKGTAKLQLEVPGAGVVRLEGTNRVRAASRRMPVAGPVGLAVKARGAAKRRLRAHGAARIRVQVAYSPDGAERSTAAERIRLKGRG